ncbi:MAG: alpha/beta fold hydrolase [Planctomycetota bacterium]
MRVVFLPGLGADERLFEPQIEAVREAGHAPETPAWPGHRPGETLPAFAGRAGDAIAPCAQTLLVGFSFGGMVALEIAARGDADHRPAGVVLISGLRSKRAVTLGFKAQQAAGRLVPRSLVRTIMTGRLVDRFAATDALSAEQTEILRDMARRTDLDFLFWAARASARWGFDGRCPSPVRHVHGRLDRTIPYAAHPDLPGGEARLVDAGHLITWTAPETVNEVILEAAGAHEER